MGDGSRPAAGPGRAPDPRGSGALPRFRGGSGLRPGSSPLSRRAMPPLRGAAPRPPRLSARGVCPGRGRAGPSCPLAPWPTVLEGAVAVALPRDLTVSGRAKRRCPARVGRLGGGALETPRDMPAGDGLVASTHRGGGRPGASAFFREGSPRGTQRLRSAARSFRAPSSLCGCDSCRWFSLPLHTASRCELDALSR